MKKSIPKKVERLFNSVQVKRFWWDGVQVNVPMHTVYAIIPNPVEDYYSNICGMSVPILALDNYRIPIWDPMHKLINKMPKFAIVLIHQESNRFGLYAYPADCLDEDIEVSYEDWFERQQA